MCDASRINRKRWVGVAMQKQRWSVSERPGGMAQRVGTDCLCRSSQSRSAAADRRRERHRRRRETPLRGLPGATDRRARVEGQVVGERVRAQGTDVVQGRLYLGNFGQGYRTVQAYDRIVAARLPAIIECEHAASGRGLGQAVVPWHQAARIAACSRRGPRPSKVKARSG